MKCPSCHQEITPDSYFCTWCDKFIPAPEKGEKAGIFARFVAATIDPFIALALWGVAIGIFAGVSEDVAVSVSIIFPLVYFGWFLSLLRKGKTPGKLLLGLQVVNHRNGASPGFGRMFVREIFGKFISGLIFFVGYFWAVFDKNTQAWHDKIAGTVVLKVRGSSVMIPKSAAKLIPPRPGRAEDNYYPPPKPSNPVTMLIALSGPLQGQQFVVDKEMFHIGASRKNDLVIATDDYVSRNHAYLYYEKGSLWLADQHSRNGTFLNKNRLKDTPLIVNIGDRIQLGDSTFEVIRVTGR